MLIDYDVAVVYTNWDPPNQKIITCENLTLLQTIASQFAIRVAHPAAIGAREDIEDIVEGKMGTFVDTQ